MSDPKITAASTLMLNFAQRSGLEGDRPPRRYLWTDAFALCNFLGLARATGLGRHNDLARRLVDQVHHTLGRHRQDDSRHGWLSGLHEREGEAHPTRGGLRIGKVHPERGPAEPYDEHREWERDGQYFHYLTKWMHALDQLSRSTGDPRYNRWARELAERAHEAFTYMPASGHAPRMYWKMSIDLSRALVSSMGQQDPLDGYITVLQLRASAVRLPQSAEGPGLQAATRKYAAMTVGADWTSPDPLGIGGLLVDAYRVTRLMELGTLSDAHLIQRILGAARTGLRYFAETDPLEAPADQRLAFRELGLSIGLHALERLHRSALSHLAATSPAANAQLRALMHYLPLAEQIESFWRDTPHRSAISWLDHLDINEVMLATSLAPDGFLDPLRD